MAAAAERLDNLKRLGQNSAVYALATLFSRGLNFLLIPVFTRALSPADYGILAVTTAVSGLLIMVLGLSLEGAITQMYLGPEEDRERRSLYGTLLVFWLVGSGLITTLLHFLGCAGYLEIFGDVPYKPYLMMVLWTSYLSIFSLLPITIYTTKQQSLKAVGLSAGSSVLTVALSLYFVVWLRQGVMGSLRAFLFSAVVMAVLSVFLVVRMASWEISWGKLKRALKFSLPIVPHSASNWGLNLLDRLVLERYVVTSQIGIYSLGYQFGTLVSIAASSINSAFYPIANLYLRNKENAGEVPRLGTYVFAGVTLIGLTIAMFGGDAIRVMAPASYQGAVAVVPWVALAFVMQGAYLVLSRGTWYSMKTGWVPVLTGIAAAVNVGLNIWLVPIYGIMAAAIDTTVAYTVLALLHGWLAHRIYPIAWEYKRCALMLCLCCLLYFVSTLLPDRPLFLLLASKAVLLAVILPLALVKTNILSVSELKTIAALVRGRARS